MIVSKKNSKSQILRLLALDYSLVKSAWGLADARQIYENIISQPCKTADDPEAELVERTAHLFFLCLFEGGIASSSPVNKFVTLRLDTSGALNGYLRWSDKTAKVAGVRLLVPGPRQFLYRPGRCALLSYTRYRIDYERARDGDRLVPELTAEIFKQAKLILPWLKTVKGKPSWQKVLVAYLRHQLNTTGKPAAESEEDAPRVGLPDLVEMSLLGLYDYELPMQLEVRRGRIIPAGIADAQYREFLPVKMQSGSLIESQKSSDSGENSSAETAEEFVIDAQPDSSFATGTVKFNKSRIFQSAAIAQARDFLARVVDSKIPPVQRIKIAEELLAQNLRSGFSPDINSFYRWLIKKLKKGAKNGNKNSTTSTYGDKLLTILRAFGENSCSTLDLNDFVLFLNQYSTANSAAAYRFVAKEFHTFLQKDLNLPLMPIDWSSPLLKFGEGYRQKPLIDEALFKIILASASHAKLLDQEAMEIALLLMRRGGLRCAEAVSIRSGDFHGLTKLRLFVQNSKSDAGKRALPLDLLLDRQELEIVRRRLLVLRGKAAGNPALLNKSFILTEDGGSLTPEQMGAEVSRVFKAAKVSLDVTAHDLRHAFATALYSAWGLKFNAGAASPSTNWARETLEKFCRPGVEGRAVVVADDIRRLMGHASIEVTFERYIHTCDLIAADRIFQVERDLPPCHLTRASAAFLIDVSDRHSQRLVKGEGKVTAARPGSEPRKNQHFSDTGEQSKISLRKLEERLTERLLGAAENHRQSEQPSVQKISSRKKSIIKKPTD